MKVKTEMDFSLLNANNKLNLQTSQIEYLKERNGNLRETIRNLMKERNK